MQIKKSIVIISLILILCMNVANVNVFATEDEEWNVIEFSVNDDGSITTITPKNTSFAQTVTALPEEFGGEAWTATNSRLTVSGKASNIGSTVSIHLRKKGLLNQYYKVNGTSATLNCDGQTHNIYSGISVTAGETYKFYYKSNGGNTHTPTVTLGIVLWD